MFVILFTSRLSEEAGAEYYATEERLQERLRAVTDSDPVEVKHYTGDDGERLTVMLWRDAETLEKWRADPGHRGAQRLGRERWYSAYELTVAEVLRTSAGGAGTTASEEPR
ncbi:MULTISPECIES: antibiotic biosynthesis monooxygenase [unclassified Streptomyces]|uniref:antibiotic biosynthesis monooxygenase family protein n=1 Tax=unclassified Streptomyces TaxID=2593676 RepID=UPI000F44CC95|nr:antibiotic biosynthesis monooxygenase [Streptomyces sp. I6]RNL73101.1 antibiotic biosynthesis monooxygenase [Streptomyces sp. I6]